jgi:hypothetical protein
MRVPPGLPDTMGQREKGLRAVDGALVGRCGFSQKGVDQPQHTEGATSFNLAWKDRWKKPEVSSGKKDRRWDAEGAQMNVWESEVTDLDITCQRRMTRFSKPIGRFLWKKFFVKRSDCPSPTPVVQTCSDRVRTTRLDLLILGIFPIVAHRSPRNADRVAKPLLMRPAIFVEYYSQTDVACKHTRSK